MRTLVRQPVLSMVLSRILLIALLCTAAPGRADTASADVSDLPPYGIAADGAMVDPWEPLNRKVFAFNEGLDKYALRPVARGYRFITPDPVENGVTNVLRNIYEFNTVLNSLLQGDVENTIHSLGRMLINTTIGLAGIFDVATPMGVERRPADFDQTLAVWGLESGPFLMVPVAGPRTVRSGFGLVVDSYTTLPSLSDERAFNWGFLAVDAIDL
ncbi:MAG: VacJ family lipoprotein, partial [Halioglobus sp.]|nr:VacJ family lipoprotein [Halioglobus sp.]